VTPLLVVTLPTACAERATPLLKTTRVSSPPSVLEKSGSTREVNTAPARDPPPRSRCARAMAKIGLSSPLRETSWPSTANIVATVVPDTLPVSLAAVTGAAIRRE
jgi:hypothetical protein